MTPKQRQALPLLAYGKTAKEVSEELKINVSTISGWMNHDPEFMGELRKIQHSASIDALNQMYGVSMLAINEVQRIMTTSDNEALRLKAATFVIEKSVGMYGK